MKADRAPHHRVAQTARIPSNMLNDSGFRCLPSDNLRCFELVEMVMSWCFVPSLVVVLVEVAVKEVVMVAVEVALVDVVVAPTTQKLASIQCEYTWDGAKRAAPPNKQLTNGSQGPCASRTNRLNTKSPSA